MEIDADYTRTEGRANAQHDILVCYPSQDGSQKLVNHACNTKDISESGLKVIARRPLPLGSIIPIDVSIVKPKSHYRFLGEVKWCLEVDDAPTFYAGIKLIKIIKNSIKNWRILAKSCLG